MAKDQPAAQRNIPDGRPTVYLAGPISGCNHEQLFLWRENLKRGFSEEFRFIDPTDELIGREGSDYEVVQADIEAIQNSDAVLANMWRESLGTAFGILHARDASKFVVVCDPNRINSRMVSFYADAIERTVEAALNAVRTFLTASKRITCVVKRDESTQAFDLHKLGTSIRKACLDAKQSDIAPPRAVIKLVLAQLLEAAQDTRPVTTLEIREAVWQAMAELASDPTQETDYDRIRQVWQSHGETVEPKPQPVLLAAPGIQINATPLQVKVHSVGTHSTIWGRTVGDRARPIFDEMRRVEGLTEIVFGPFNNTGSPPAKPHVRLAASKTPNIIEGKCYDLGPKGTLQTFQIRVANPDSRDEILSVLREHLLSVGHIRAET